MIQEDYCSDELSKLLKEKGFDWNIRQYYALDSKTNVWELEYDDNQGNYNIYGENPISAPTQQMAMKWLRKKHGLHISVAPYLNEEGEVTWVWEIINIETATIIADSLDDDDDFNSCEEAVEASLKHCLTELI